MHLGIVRWAGGFVIVFVTAATLFADDESPVGSGEEQAAPTSVVAAQETPPDAAVAEAAVAEAAPRPLRHGVFRWTSYPAAWTAAQKTNRPILMFVTSPGCPHCVKMLAETYQAPHISPLVVDSFETVYVDRATQPELVAKLKIKWFPTTIVVGANNKVIDVLEGYVDPMAFTNRIKTGLAASAPETQTR